MDDNNQSNPFISVFTPVALLSLSLCMLFFSQIKGAGQGKENMTWQTSNADKQLANLHENLGKLDKIIADQTNNTGVAEQTQKQFSDFMKDLIELGSGEKPDKDALLVMQVAGQMGVRVNMGAGEAKKDAGKDEKKDK